MLKEMKPLIGKVLTALGPEDPSVLGNVLMHEHLYADIYDGEKDRMIWEETPLAPERRKYLFDDAVPLLKECREKHGLRAFCDATTPPFRAWPDVYEEMTRATGVHAILSTGSYREIETGTYMVKTPDRAIWPFVRESPVGELADFFIREIVEGLHGSRVRTGCIKLASSQAPMTEAEAKAFRAGARAQKATGVHVTTHCTILGAETSQLTILDSEGVDLRRVIVGHTAGHLMDKTYRRTVIEWMKRGASFMPTNLDVAQPERWQPLIDAIHAVFDAGHGDKLFFGMDHGYGTERGRFERMWFMPPPPFLYMFDAVLPAFRRMGLTAEEERTIMAVNPRRIIPVQ